jgi:hypothetical protein
LIGAAAALAFFFQGPAMQLRSSSSSSSFLIRCPAEFYGAWLTTTFSEQNKAAGVTRHHTMHSRSHHNAIKGCIGLSCMDPYLPALIKRGLFLSLYPLQGGKTVECHRWSEAETDQLKGNGQNDNREEDNEVLQFSFCDSVSKL